MTKYTLYKSEGRDYLVPLPVLKEPDVKDNNFWITIDFLEERFNRAKSFYNEWKESWLLIVREHSFVEGQEYEEEKDFKKTCEISCSDLCTAIAQEEDFSCLTCAIPIKKETNSLSEAIRTKEQADIFKGRLNQLKEEDNVPSPQKVYLQLDLGTWSRERVRPNDIEYVPSGQSPNSIEHDSISKHLHFQEKTDDKWWLQTSVKEYLNSGKVSGSLLEAIKKIIKEVLSHAKCN